MERRILDFIGEHHLLTIAAAAGEDIWCANAFYAFDPRVPAFVITSDENTRHIRLALSGCAGNGRSCGNSSLSGDVSLAGDNPVASGDGMSGVVSGTIALETEKIGMIRGLQFKAILKRAGNSLMDEFRLLYLKRFPYALLKGGDLWILELTELKFTDNRLGFGKKLKWEKPGF